MKTPRLSLRCRLDEFSRQLPGPARLLRLARLLIPVALFAGLVTEPFLRWLLRTIGAGA